MDDPEDLSISDVTPAMALVSKYAQYADADGALVADRAAVPTHTYLFHYTNAHGMVGMVDTHSIWLSDARYMNDSSELAYALDLIERETAAAFARSTADVRSVMPGLNFDLVKSQLASRLPFIACFCEEGDLLSQWRWYAAGDVGYSLGLDFRYHLDPDMALRKVIYEPTDQVLLVKSMFGALTNAIEASLQPRGPYTAEQISQPATDLLLALLVDRSFLLSIRRSPRNKSGV